MSRTKHAQDAAIKGNKSLEAPSLGGAGVREGLPSCEGSGLGFFQRLARLVVGLSAAVDLRLRDGHELLREAAESFRVGRWFGFGHGLKISLSALVMMVAGNIASGFGLIHEAMPSDSLFSENIKISQRPKQIDSGLFVLSERDPFVESFALHRAAKAVVEINFVASCENYLRPIIFSVVDVSIPFWPRRILTFEGHPSKIGLQLIGGRLAAIRQPKSIRIMRAGRGSFIVLQNGDVGPRLSLGGFFHHPPLGTINDSLKDSDTDQGLSQINHRFIGGRFFVLLATNLAGLFLAMWSLDRFEGGNAFVRWSLFGFGWCLIILGQLSWNGWL